MNVRTMPGSLIGLLACLFAGFSPARAQNVTPDPDRVPLEVDDIRRMASVLRSLSAPGPVDTAAALDRQYLAQASPGLRAYAGNFGVTGAVLRTALSASPSRYRNLDGLADAILAQEQSLRAAFQRLKELFPDAVFPPIWFVVGHNGPGGLTRAEGVLIAAERFADRPEDVVPLVLHELAHFQQAMVQGVEVYQRIYGPGRTLLALALREGSADLIATLTTGRHINPAAEAYGVRHEAALWAAFREVMNGPDTGDWMFVHPADTTRPPDLGYWMGYRIAKHYYDNAGNKPRAIREILGLTNFASFLRASGYAGGGGVPSPLKASVTHPALRDELLQMEHADQALRNYDSLATLTEAGMQAALRAMAIADSAHRTRLRVIIAEFGWPTPTMVGRDGVHAAFLLLQHADKDPAFQARMLPVLEAAARRGEVAPRDVAYLTDRVRVKQGLPQEFGTQYPPKTDALGNVLADEQGRVIYLLPVVRDLDRLDERRRAAGLGPWCEYERRMAERQGRDPVPRPNAAPDP